MGPSERASKLKVDVIPAITESTLPQECDTLTLFASLQANGSTRRPWTKASLKNHLSESGVWLANAAHARQEREDAN